MTIRAKKNPKAALYHRVAARELGTGATCLKLVHVGLPARSYLRRTTHYPILFLFLLFFHKGAKNVVTNTLPLKAGWSAGTASTTTIHHSQNDQRTLLITASRSLLVPCNRTSTSSHASASTDQWSAGAVHTAETKASSSMWQMQRQ